MDRYFIIYKPYKMISQFVSPYKHRLLGDLNFEFPEGTNAVGRLDDDSEGLLVLTTDKSLTKRLLHPTRQHKRNYIVQVERKVEMETIQKLSNGLDILIKKKGTYTTLPCEVTLIEKPANLPSRDHSFKEFLPHSWLEFVLIEGKNRQIRKMCSAVRHDCKRLIRTKIEDLELGTMQPGDVKEIEQAKLFELLRLTNDN
ncbi:pseudouridine synthase [Aurantibacillus circumpalustris]|uniref:pseudouridine synthase n=1 Tax=Aurantibacillus circumpalustris TaxID=3036359 RepID=UPI00295A904B|nr:pseudouridine synthase [Aurantibacillus circumpalustris]